jgi:hypothetical protein
MSAKRSTAAATSVANNTHDAYSYASYVDGEWKKCAAWLFSQSLSAAQVECVLRSKHMRWSADMENGHATCAGFKRYMAKHVKPRDIMHLFLDCGVAYGGW